MLIRELSAHPKVKLYKEAKLLEIVGNAHVEAAKFELKGEPEQTLPIAGAFVYLQGGRPITDYLQGQLEVGETGCLIVDREFKTTVEGVYAVGDVLCNHVKQVVVAAGEGAVAGMAVEKTLRGRKQIKADWAK
jgi:thioredoxin reductase (NADPH)